MKFNAKLVKDLQVGDRVYMNIFSKDGVGIGIDYLGKVIELLPPTTCMGLVGYGYAQFFDTYDKDIQKIIRRQGFESIPILIGEEEFDEGYR